MIRNTPLALACTVLALGRFAWAAVDTVAVTPLEMAEQRSWAAAKFEAAVVAPPVEPGLVVVANYREVQRNAREGQPLRIGTVTFTRGLYCHAPSRILVRLPGPGARFEAVVGIDSNGNYGGGSVVFKVDVGGRDAFTSRTLVRGEPGVAVRADLGGTSEFVLVVTDAGDNFNSDQASWADAKATLVDGQEVWLGDLPITEHRRAPFTSDPPFSFVYDEKPSSLLLKDWPVERAAELVDEARTRHTLVWRDPKTGLEVRWVAIEYRDFPTIEWTVHFKNAGKDATPALVGIQAIDTRIERSGEGEFVLHHHKGTFVRADDFEPLTTPLAPLQKLRFAPPGGRPLGQVFPYYNIEWSGEGMIIVVGWPGQWAAEFARDGGTGLRVMAGQEQTHLTLEPGESIRSPLMVIQFYRGDWVRAQNLWRRWMIAHNIPRRGGQLPPPMMPAVSGNQFPGLLCNEADELRYINRYLEEGIQITHWWMDAGWYVNRGDWTSVGTWEVDTKRFPRGLRAISDHVHARGIELLVWFEPERVTAGSWLAEQHPDWVLGGKKGGLLDLGNREAWTWLVERYDKLLTEQGIDFYRQDFNMDPLGAWRAQDAPDRQGITENKHVAGYLAFWDELVRRHPKMLIDSCASGGHRNDLETLRRSLPLLRSDYILDPTGNQGHTFGLSFWMPYWGTGFIDFSPYLVRSMMGTDMTLSCDARRKDLDWDLLRKLVAQWRQIVPNVLGDFYPLTPYSLQQDTWMAWQFDRPEAGEGMVQAFRRAESIFRSAELRLRGLEPAAHYAVTDLDTSQPRHLTGLELMEKGLLVDMAQRPGAAVLTYKKTSPR